MLKSDDNFIVKYKRDYYISKSKYDEMLEAVINDEHYSIPRRE